MAFYTSAMPRIIDAHVHMGTISEQQVVLDICRAAGIESMALVSIQNPAQGSGLPQSLYMKARHPEQFYVFAGLNHAAKLTDGRVKAPSLAEQVRNFADIGCDGIKMIEGKPTSRQRMNVPVTDPYYAEYWATVEELGTPIVWHVNDPEEFWDPERLPGWARQRNWGYGPEDVQKEQLYAEVDEVLARHPELNIIFAHFYFLSADLPRAARVLDAHPTVCFDLTPGIEMLYNISKDRDAGREFFIRYADRIVFGTDIASRMSVEEASSRAGIVFRWLENTDTFRVPTTVDVLLGPPEDGVINGMELPREVLEKIYRGNFVRMAAAAPRALNVAGAIEECERIAAIAAEMSDMPAGETEAGTVVERLKGK